MSPLTFNKYATLSVVVSFDPKFKLDGAETVMYSGTLCSHDTSEN